MKLHAWHVGVVGIAAAVGLISTAHVTQAHIGPAKLYPNSALTSGLAATLKASDLQATYNGQTYSQANRNVPESEKLHVYAEYGITGSHPTGSYEVDHFYPLCAGGSNDISNLWPEPATNIWNGADYGFHTKDKLETYICAQIKKGTLDPKVAYQKVTTDWVEYYLEIFGANASATTESADPVQ
jgi:hypothetical protein